MRIPLAIALSFALAACGARPAPTAVAEDENASAIAIAPDGQPAPSGEPEGITAIDAATGEARAMPADSAAPSAYDLARRAERSKDAAAQHDAHAEPAPARLDAPASLLGSDDSVTTGG